MADEPKTFDFVVNDESILNSFGFRVMTAGISLKQFNRNPVVIYYHKREGRYDSNHVDEVRLPVGKALKAWKEGGLLKMKIQFDSGHDDKLADKIEGKYERGYLNMVSLGADPVAISEDPKHLLPGQTRPTITKCILNEVSVVDIGGNDNALRLAKNQDIDLILPMINLSKNNKMDLKAQLAAQLGLDVGVADNVILEAVGKQITLAAKAKNLETQIETLQTAQREKEEQEIIALADTNVDKKFTADKKESMIALGKKLGAADFKIYLSNMANVDGKITDTIIPGSEGGSGGAKPDSELTFAKLRDQGSAAFEKFKKANPTKYIQLFKDEYGYEPDLSND